MPQIALQFHLVKHLEKRFLNTGHFNWNKCQFFMQREAERWLSIVERFINLSNYLIKYES